MSAMSLSFICHPAAGLQTSSCSSITTPTSSVSSRGLKRAREEDEQPPTEVIDLTECEEEEAEHRNTKRRKVQAGPEPLPRIVRPLPVESYAGLGLGHPACRTTPRIASRACALQRGRPFPEFKRTRHPVWKTEWALRGLPSPTIPYSPPATFSVLPPFSSLLGGDFSQYPMSGAGVGLGFTVDLAPLLITPDEM